jgi:putative ABC transport system substrate-binding protein
MIARRHVAVLIGASVLAPHSSSAQQEPKVRRVGFLSLDTQTGFAAQMALEQFPAALAKYGYRIDRDLVIEWRWAEGKPAELPELAAGLVRAHVDVIVARTNDPIRAAMDATRSTAIVMLNGNYPVESGLVQSLARPGGNVTGTAYVSPQTVGKQLELLKELDPRARRVALVGVRSISQYGLVIQASLARAAANLGLTVQHFDARIPDEVPAMMEEVFSSKCDALWFSGSAVLRSRIDDILAALLRRRMPSVANIPLFAEKGGLAHYAPDVGEFFERTAGYVNRILKGAKPADLPVQQPTKYELAVNLETAKAIGVTVPAAVLARADRVIG